MGIAKNTVVLKTSNENIKNNFFTRSRRRISKHMHVNRRQRPLMS